MVKIISACIIALSPVSARAETGTTAMPFLKIDSGARAAALGGAYSAAGDDAASVFYNPAGAALADRKELELSHNEWLQGLRNENLAYVQPLGKNFTAFGGANVLLSGAMNKYDASGGNTGSFNSLEGAFSLGLAAGLGGNCYGAAALKTFYQKADKNSAFAFGGDAGLLKIYGDWSFGASVSNLGAKLKLGSTAFSLPLIIRAGAANRLNEQFLLSADAVKAGESQTAFCAGAEGEFMIRENEAFFVRAGYKSGRSQYTGPGFTAGIGIKNNDLRLDYAFSPYGDLGDSHRITLSFRFGVTREDIQSTKKYPRPSRKPAGKRNKPAEKKKDKEGIPLIW
ncbi:MAG: PorV/PorQ family protein [Elusimicrobia bacterium]|nr:PorV/PorQ family protein [Elusimicrobiota bacterium]